VIEAVILVPVHDNNGQRFDRALWRELERRLLQFGGLTDTGTVRGVWQSGTRVYRDTNRQFTVSLRTWRQFPAWLAVAEWVRTAFSQEAVYVRVASVPEILD
jgi:hypothetical protein